MGLHQHVPKLMYYHWSISSSDLERESRSPECIFSILIINSWQFPVLDEVEKILTGWKINHVIQWFGFLYQIHTLKHIDFNILDKQTKLSSLSLFRLFSYYCTGESVTRKERLITFHCCSFSRLSMARAHQSTSIMFARFRLIKEDLARSIQGLRIQVKNTGLQQSS